MDRQVQHEGLIPEESSPSATCTDCNMVAEPVGSAASVLEPIQAIEEKLKSLASSLSTVEQQATEAVGRSVLTNV